MLRFRRLLVIREWQVMAHSSDAIITVFIAGGLLDAGYKKVRYDQAKKELGNISADIEEFSSDLLAMQPVPVQVAIAQLR